MFSCFFEFCDSKIQKKCYDASYNVPKFLKMKVVENGTADEIKNMAEKCIDKQKSIRSDKAKSYPKGIQEL